MPTLTQWFAVALLVAAIFGALFLVFWLLARILP